MEPSKCPRQEPFSAWENFITGEHLTLNSHSLKQSLQLHHTTCRNVHEINSVLSVLSFHNATGDIRPNGDRYIYHIQLSGITDSSISNCLGANICQVKINDSYRRKIGTSSKAKYYIKGEIKSISDYIRSYSAWRVRTVCSNISVCKLGQMKGKVGFIFHFNIYFEIQFITITNVKNMFKFKIFCFCLFYKYFLSLCFYLHSIY